MLPTVVSEVTVTENAHRRDLRRRLRLGGERRGEEGEGAQQ